MHSDEPTGGNIEVPISLYVENDVECDDDGILQVTTYIMQDEDDDDSVEFNVKFETIIAAAIDYYQQENNNDARNRMYCIAHELSRQAEKLRNKADDMDRGLYSDDLFKEEEKLPN